MTLKEIASMAGVSAATVSYVLNNSAQISDETRQRVEKIIKETGYRSNMLAKSLRTNETKLVGILVEDVTVWHTGYIIDGINEIAEQRGYNTILSNLRLISKIETHFDDLKSYQKDINRALDMLIGMRVDGIIYVGMHDRRIDHVLQDTDVPIVYCYCYTEGEGCSVRYSNRRASYLLTQRLIQMGHRDFGVINGMESSEPARMRFQGFKSALNKAKILLKEENVQWGDWDYQKGKEAAFRLLDKEQRPTAVIAMNDEMAVGVYHAAAELGLRIPDDVSVTGFDNTDIGRYVTPRITTVDRPLQEMGYRSMEILLNCIGNERQEETSVVLPCTIIEGGSVKKIKNSGSEP